VDVGATHGEEGLGVKRAGRAQRGGAPDEHSEATAFKRKLSLVYLGIAALLGLLFVWFQFDTAFMLEWLPYLLKGVPLTLLICFGGIALATVLALLGALGRLSSNAIPQGIANFYVSFIRGTPLLVQLFFIFFALPQLAFKPSSPAFLESIFVLQLTVAAILALGINYGAYMTEIFRAGIQSIGHGQVEAAHALGMTASQSTRRIILPQAVRVVVPPTGNEFIAMLKDSSLVGVVGGQELFFRAQTTGNAQAHTFETFAVAAMIYWFLTSVFSFFQKRLENKVARGHVREQLYVH